MAMAPKKLNAGDDLLTQIMQVGSPAREATAENARGDRNRNPGNLRGPFANRQPGFRGVDRDGFAIYDTEANGIRAQERLLAEGRNFRGRSVAQIVNTYTPGTSDNAENGRRNYVGYVAASLGIDPDQPVPAALVPRMAAAMREHENGRTRREVRFQPYAGSGLTRRDGGANANTGTGTVSTNPTAPQIELPQLPPATPATAEERARMDVAKEFTLVNPHTAGPQAATNADRVDDRTLDADVMLQNTIAGINQIQDERTALLGEVVAEKGEIIDQQATITNEAIARATPLWQRRADIVRRRSELRAMNPISRLFRGLTDSRYNEVMIANEAASTNEELAVIQQNATEARGLLGERLANVNAAAETALMPLANAEANFEQDLQLAGQNIASASRIAQGLGMRLGQQAELEGAQAASRTQILSNLNEGQLLAGLEMARGNNGVAIINGVEFQQQELQVHADRLEDQRYARAGMVMGLQSQQLQFADMSETRYIQTLTPEQRAEALANGGQFQGQTLSPVKLADAVAADNAAGGVAAGNIMTQNIGQVLSDSFTQLGTNLDTQVARARAIFGSVPPEMTQFQNQIVQRSHAITSMLEQAGPSSTPAGRAARVALMEEVNGYHTRLTEIATAAATRWAGNNHTLRTASIAWMTGQPLAPSESANALISMARGGGQQGGAMSPQAQQMYGEVTRIVRDWDRNHAGERRDEAGLVRSVTDTLRGQRSDSMLDTAVRNAPAVAAQIQVNGRPHPFSRIPLSAMNAAVEQGDRDGIAAVASSIGGEVTESVVRAALAGNAAARAAIEAQKPGTNIGRQVLAAQTSATLNLLDGNYRTSNFRPSEAFADLMANPEYQRRVLADSRAAPNQSFGDYVTHSAAGDTFAQSFGSYVQTARAAAAANHGTNMANVAREANTMLGSPSRRVEFILGAIDGVSDADADLFTSFLQARVEGYNSGGHASTIITNIIAGDEARDSVSGVADTMGEITAIITGPRLEDPRLESIRARVAREWGPISQYLNGGMRRVATRGGQ